MRGEVGTKIYKAIYVIFIIITTQQGKSHTVALVLIPSNQNPCKGWFVLPKMKPPKGTRSSTNRPGTGSLTPDKSKVQ